MFHVPTVQPLLHVCASYSLACSASESHSVLAVCKLMILDRWCYRRMARESCYRVQEERASQPISNGLLMLVRGNVITYYLGELELRT